MLTRTSQDWKGGPPTAVDRQLGLGYGAAAVRALSEDRSGVVVAFHPPDLTFVPLAEAINKIKTVRNPAGGTVGTTRELYGIAPEEDVTFARFLELIHPEDRERPDGVSSHRHARGEHHGKTDNH